jgi:hypothetical protein
MIRVRTVSVLTLLLLVCSGCATLALHEANLEFEGENDYRWFVEQKGRAYMTEAYRHGETQYFAVPHGGLYLSVSGEGDAVLQKGRPAEARPAGWGVIHLAEPGAEAPRTPCPTKGAAAATFYLDDKYLHCLPLEDWKDLYLAPSKDGRHRLYVAGGRGAKEGVALQNGMSTGFLHGAASKLRLTGYLVTVPFDLVFTPPLLAAMWLYAERWPAGSL